MKRVKHQEIMEFTYSTKEEREEHVKSMVVNGWEDSGTMSRLKKGKSIYDLHAEENREWFARFQKFR